MTPTLEERAYHEAGHAVAAYLLRVPLLGISILPEGTSAGHTKVSVVQLPPGVTLWDIRPRDRRDLERCLMVAMAGHAADALRTGVSTADPDFIAAKRSGYIHDLTIAHHIAAPLCGSELEAYAYIDWLGLRIENVLGQPAHWRAVEAVAQALLASPRLGVRRARMVISRAMEPAGAAAPPRA